MNRFKRDAAAGRKKFDSEKDLYKDELDKLKGLSDDELNDLLPDTTDRSVYNALIKVVEEAATKNLEQAKLVDNIKALGDVALSIARKIPALSAIL